MQKGTTENTNHIKGLAITAVFITHYVLAVCQDCFSLYGHQFVSIYFILSGYGLYFSLSKSEPPSLKLNYILRYVAKRALRIYPLYWLWLLTCFVSGSIDPASLDVANDIFLIGYKDSPQWFLVPLFHCYIIAPILYVMFIRKFTITLAAIITLLIFAQYICIIFGVPIMTSYAYLGVFGSHIYLFSFGMYLHHLKKLNHITTARILAIISFVILIISFEQIKSASLIPILSRQYSNYMALAAASLFVYAAMQVKSTDLPFRTLLCHTGKYSFSIYIFHGKFVNILKILYPSFSTASNVAMLILIYILCITLCPIVEVAANSTSKHVYRYIAEKLPKD